MVPVYTNCLLIFILVPNLRHPLLIQFFRQTCKTMSGIVPSCLRSHHSLVISFDGVPGPIVREVLDEDENLRIEKFWRLYFF